MFHRLTYDVTFPPTLAAPNGRRLNQDLRFEEGFWAIVGPNESGKSFILEMLRFALFGSLALRGTADGYKTLKMSAEFTIKGERYSVTRTMKSAELKRGSEVVATGVSVVNQKIVEILGYGLAVFDIANAVMQGEVERLGSLTPMQRKNLLDSVIGIDALELVGKWAMEEARILGKEAEAVRRTLVEPLPPTKPDNYRPTAEIDLAQLRADAAELAELEGFLKVEVPKPEQPTCNVDLPAANLRQFAEKRRELREAVAALEAKIATLPASVAYNECQLNDAAAEWERYDRYEEAQRWLKANPEPQYTEAQLQQWLTDYRVLSSWEAHDERQEKIGRLRHQLQHLDTATCPECSHEFPLDQQTAEQLREQLADLEAVEPPPHDRPVKPPLRRQEIVDQVAMVAGYDFAKRREMLAVEALDRPTIDRHMIPVLRAQIGQVEERSKAVAEAARKGAELQKMPDYEQMLVERTRYEEELPRYRQALAAWEAWKVERAQKQGRAKVLAGARERLTEAEAVYAVSQAYEADLDRFEKASEVYVKGLEEAEELEAKADEHRKVRDVMTLLRSKVKQHLMPSLNKVASYLLSQMTGGQRNVIAMDEDFNVLVDGQELDTLSGSGKACANLAIRIAIGQVLTNRVFSVLMADEIDAAMDDFRAEQTSNVLCTLENSISQVLQVSHKSIGSSNLIDLGVTVDRSLVGEAA